MKGKILLFFAFVACMSLFGYIKAEQGDFDTLGLDSVNGYAYWRVDSSGYLKPGVASTLDIGTSALPVRNLYVGAVTLTDKLKPATVTLAVLLAKTPAAKGEIWVVSDGTYPICISSGTGVGAYTIFSSTTTVCS